MRRYTAIFDACVFYPALLRDLLMYLTRSDIFSAKWSASIQEEWMRNLLKNRPDITRERLERTCELMDIAVPDAMVTDYEALTSSLSLPDPDDCHVLAAAIVAKADVIVTFNMKDFPADALQPYEIEAQHPDDFILCQIDLHQGLMFKWIKTHRNALKNPEMDVETYLGALRAQQLTQTAARLTEYQDLL